jgi:UPF0755 protein
MGLLKIAAAAAILLLLAAGVAVGWTYYALNSPVAHAKSDQIIAIEKGTAPSLVISKLAAEGILESELAVKVYFRTFGDATRIQAGDYRFRSPITALEVLSELEKGEAQTTRLTIPEGFTRFDIAKRIAANFPQDPPMSEADIIALMDDTSLIRDIFPTARNLEGYMYPSTYEIPRGASPKDIIRITVEQFRKFWRPEWAERARAQGRTPHEIVTIASLIETETGVEHERPIVAGVINNRLEKNIPLGIDQTNVYIAKMLGKWDGTIHKSDLEVDSPYNTRIKTGLPPGPISSVSESSIRAALEPQENDFIFYVRNVELNDGSHLFYASAAEFEKGKARYQQWLENERKLQRLNNSNTQ